MGTLKSKVSLSGAAGKGKNGRLFSVLCFSRDARAGLLQSKVLAINRPDINQSSWSSSDDGHPHHLCTATPNRSEAELFHRGSDIFFTNGRKKQPFLFGVHLLTWKVLLSAWSIYPRNTIWFSTYFHHFILEFFEDGCQKALLQWQRISRWLPDIKLKYYEVERIVTGLVYTSYCWCA